MTSHSFIRQVIGNCIHLENVKNKKQNPGYGENARPLPAELKIKGFLSFTYKISFNIYNTINNESHDIF